MEKSLTIDLRALAAISHCAGTEPTRYHLNGVFVQATSDHVTYVATDSQCLAAVRRKHVESNDELLTGEWIIPTEICRAFKFSSCGAIPTATLKQGAGRLELTLTHKDGTRGFKAIDGTFPNWRRVIPQKFSGEVAQFNPKTMMRLVKVGEILNGDKQIPITAHNGAGPALARWGTTGCVANAFGLIMPFRGCTPEMPEWFTDPAECVSDPAECVSDPAECVSDPAECVSDPASH